MQCHGTCERGLETRQVVCSSRSGQRLDDELCDESRKPDASRSCTEDEACQTGVQWFASQWAPVSKLYEGQHVSRTVTYTGFMYIYMYMH